MAGERAGHSLQATVLVNEAYLRLVDANDVAWHDRAHFLAVAAVRCAASSWITHASGGAEARRHSDESGLRRGLVAQRAARDFAALDHALEALARSTSERPRRRAAVLRRAERGGDGVGVQGSPETVSRDWQLARAWLQREMRGDRST